jgi:hypothetical protein
MDVKVVVAFRNFANSPKKGGGGGRARFGETRSEVGWNKV